MLSKFQGCKFANDSILRGLQYYEMEIGRTAEQQINMPTNFISISRWISLADSNSPTVTLFGRMTSHHINKWKNSGLGWWFGIRMVPCPQVTIRFIRGSQESKPPIDHWLKERFQTIIQTLGTKNIKKIHQQPLCFFGGHIFLQKLANLRVRLKVLVI